jgi:hypothetical protein
MIKNFWHKLDEFCLTATEWILTAGLLRLLATIRYTSATQSGFFEDKNTSVPRLTKLSSGTRKFSKKSKAHSSSWWIWKPTAKHQRTFTVKLQEIAALADTCGAQTGTNSQFGRTIRPEHDHPASKTLMVSAIS